MQDSKATTKASGSRATSHQLLPRGTRSSPYFQLLLIHSNIVDGHFFAPRQAKNTHACPFIIYNSTFGTGSITPDGEHTATTDGAT